MFLVVFTISVPFIVCNLCYAYGDDSCVNLEAGNLDITLKTYLAVDGIFGAIGMLIVSLCICCFAEKFNDINKSCLGKTIGTLITLFGLSWTITGAIIFWKLIDNNKCDKGVYNYVFTQLIIKFVCYFFRMLQNNNNNNNNNNN
jgi:predicted transporter